MNSKTSGEDIIEERSKLAFLLALPWWSVYIFELYWLFVLLFLSYSLTLNSEMVVKLVLFLAIVGAAYLFYRTHVGIPHLLRYAMVLKLCDDQLIVQTICSVKNLDLRKASAKPIAEAVPMAMFLYPKGGLQLLHDENEALVPADARCFSLIRHRLEASETTGGALST